MLKAAGCLARDYDLALAGLVCVLFGATLSWFLARWRSRRARHLESLVNATIEGVILEQDGFIRDVNPALCIMADRTADTLIDRRLTALIRGLTLTRADRPGEYDLLRGDGNPCPVDVLWRDGPVPG